MIKIEERAKEKYPCFPCHHECDYCITPDVRQAYIDGATEQKDIDLAKINDLLQIGHITGLFSTNNLEGLKTWVSKNL